MTEINTINGNGASSTDDPIALAWARYNKLKKIDDAKNALIEVSLVS
jgi:hypothetical protein